MAIDRLPSGSFRARLMIDGRPAFGELPLLEVLRADHDQLCRQLPDSGSDGDAAVARECLELILEEAAEDLRTGSIDVSAPVREHRSGC